MEARNRIGLRADGAVAGRSDSEAEGLLVEHGISGLPAADAAKVMLGASVNRLPVVDAGRLVGIVTRADLVRAFVRPDAEIAKDILTWHEPDLDE